MSQHQGTETNNEDGDTTNLVPILSVEELLNGPLFHVAGIFEIDIPGWVERHDELLGEAYRQGKQ